MTQVIKFPELRPPSRGGPIRELPTPAQYRQTTPAILKPAAAVAVPRLERKRLWMWFGIAVALHAALFIAIWLTPPLRLKWTPSPDDWVRVVSLPPDKPKAPATGKAKPSAGQAHGDEVAPTLRAPQIVPVAPLAPVTPIVPIAPPASTLPGAPTTSPAPPTPRA